MSNLLQEAIPNELKTRKQWVVWRYDTREGKTTKVPYRADGAGMASTTDTATWDTYEAANKASGFDGIGFVVTFPYTGIDIDHCRDPQTGELSEYAKTVIGTLNSYTEVTPSQAGIRVWVKGKLISEGHKNNKLNIEFYDSERYFTITGNHLDGTPFAIEERQAELTKLHFETFPKVEASKPGGNGAHPVNIADSELIGKAMSAANGAAFSRLWGGDTSGNNNDDSAADLALCCRLAFWTGKDPARMDALFRQSGLYREKWERQDYRDRTIKKAIEGTSETYNPHNGDGAAPQNSADAKGIRPPEEFSFNDAGNGRRLIALFGDEIKYNYPRQKWLVWNGKKWQWDDGNLIMQRAKKTVLAIYKDAATITDDNKRNNLIDWARKCENVAKLKSMCESAQDEPGIKIDITQLDADPWLFNCENCTINLKTGETKPHDRKDFCSIVAPVKYIPGAKYELWEKYLDRVMDHDKEIIGYLQKFSGMSMTADTSEEKIAFLQGPSGAGKSTFIYAQRTLMGDYAYTLNAETLMLHRDDFNRPNTNDELANLNGKRCVFAREIQKDSRLNAAEIKSMTGGEQMNVARKYEHAIEFQPIYKLWLSGNHKPIIEDTTGGVWRRLKLFPFEVVIPDSEQDEGLKKKLTRDEELSGILNWNIAGALSWLKEGLKEPEKIKSATNDYRKHEDKLLDYIEVSLSYDPQGEIGKHETHDAYCEWEINNERTPLEFGDFKKALEERGQITDHRITSGTEKGKVGWRGIRRATLEELEGRQKPENTLGSEEVKKVKDIPESIPHEGNELPFTKNASLSSLNQNLATKNSEEIPPVKKFSENGIEKSGEKTTKNSPDTLSPQVFTSELHCNKCGKNYWWVDENGNAICNTCHPINEAKK